MDRFSLKQTFFNVENIHPKQGGGFLSGQSGLAAEVSLLIEAISNGVPAVLCDLTNVLRFGDVCLLGASDPVPIEVKSSKAKDTRAKRQKKKMGTLTKFLETDQATDFRGITGTTFQTVFSSPPRSFDNVLEAAISEAVSKGTSTFEVDGCLKFGVIADGKPDYDTLFSDMNPSRTLVNFINQIKTSMIWGCYVPYALSLSKPDHYEMFVRGEIIIISLLNMADFEIKLASDGVTLTVEADEESIQCRIDFTTLGGDLDACSFIIGEHMMCRMWTDFLDPSWIVQNSIDTVKNNARQLALAHDAFIDAATLK